MKHSKLILTLVTLSILWCSFSQPSMVLAQKKTSPMLAQLFAKYKSPFTKMEEGLYKVPFEGKVFPQFDVLVATVSNDLAVLIVILAKKDELKLTPELMHKLLRLNSELDGTKIGINDKGDILATLELNLKGIELADFSANIETLASGADEIYKEIKPNLIADAKP